MQRLDKKSSATAEMANRTWKADMNLKL